MLHNVDWTKYFKHVEVFADIWDIEVSIGLMFLPSIRDEFRYMWE